MKKLSYNIARIGLGVTFIWIGILILRNPEGWGSLLQPWAADLLTFPLVPAMIGNAVLDIAIGVFLILNISVWLAALVGAGHIFSVLVVTGITDITVRDIAILGSSLALAIETLPEFITNRFPFLK